MISDETSGSTGAASVDARVAPAVDREIDIDDEFAALAGSLNLLHASFVHLAARVIDSEEWRQHAMRTPAAYLAWITGTSPERAKTIVALAERRDQYPLLFAAFERGELSLEQVAESVKGPSWADATITDLAEVCTVTKLRKVMRSNLFTGPPDEPEPAASLPETRVSFGVNRHGRWTMRGDFDLADGRRIEAALTERKDALFADGDTEVTWADALLDCMNRSLTATASSSRRDQYRTWVHIDVTSGVATTTDGWRIPQALQEHLTCDGVIQPVWEREGVPFSVGRAQHIVPARTRRIIERRDRGCRVPGCTAGRFVEVHHIVHWEHGGVTDTWNLVSLCRKHHQLHHQGQLGVTGNADTEHGLTFTDWSGRVIGPNGQPSPTDRPPPQPHHPYVPPINGRMDWAWLGGWTHPDTLAQTRQQAA